MARVKGKAVEKVLISNPICSLPSSSTILASDSTPVICHYHCLLSPRMKSWRSKEPTMGKPSSTDEHGRCMFHGDIVDPRSEFLQFLEEARQSGPGASDCRKGADRITPETEKERKKKKKSWRKGVLSWWKSEEKKSGEGDGKLHRKSRLPSTRSVDASGPVKSRGMAVNGGHRHSMWGPLSSLFNSSRRDGTQIPYSSIDNLHSSPVVVRSYGPIYLVT